jgi:hypothetical protein
VTLPGDVQDAKRLREQFVQVLKQYPPNLGYVLRLDPTLFNNEAFLAPYPAVVAFVAQHPEVKRNTSYFLENFSSDYYSSYRRSDAGQMWDDMFSGVGVLVIFTLILSALGWTIRTFMDYRRWNRLSKTQTDVHTKLLDRFTANDELIAYVQSPAGRKFLESQPITLDTGPKSLAAPFGRILWSVQAGLVAAAAGVGLVYVSSRMAADFVAGRVTEDISQPMFTMGVFALSLGIGFVASAFVAYILSKRLGLMDPPKPAGYDRTENQRA